MSKARRIAPSFVERVWGRTDLSPLYGPQTKRIGEVWFPAGPDFPILVKFIFTSERLSIQVHPKDDYALEYEDSRGKTEMWHILAAEPGATVALGMKDPVTSDVLRASIADGSVVNLLNWVPVEAGNTLFAPAGTVHAIGGGLILCEIQQNSDITYRLFDYGRPRELHLDKGLAVSDTGTCDGRRELPVSCEHFRTEMLDLASPIDTDIKRDHLLITLQGLGIIAGCDFQPGECWFVPADSGQTVVNGEPGCRVLRASAPNVQAA